MNPKKVRILVFGLIILAVFFIFFTITKSFANQLKNAYQKQDSQVIYDRNGKLIEILPNSKGNYDQFITATPEQFKNLLLTKEDRFFYVHPGFNPFSWIRDLWTWGYQGQRGGSSTITQQLVKILLGNENKRSLKNKLQELFYTVSLEWHTPKNQILLMYANSAYFGNQSQGLKQAAQDYFNLPAETLNNAQTLSLLAALNSPSKTQPVSPQNIEQAKVLAANLNIKIADEDWKSLSLAKTNPSPKTTDAGFEVNSLNLNCQTNCQLTLDSTLSQSIREILKRNLTSSDLQTAQNGAVVVIKLPENEILSIVGSPDPSSTSEGMQLNMALKPRAIGSTSKPFIYLNAFKKGARPYSLVDDTELKYTIGTGFDFYPKNFDGQYRGLVTLHQALDNSLNIPSVQVLEFVGLDTFYKFLQNGLGFKPLQPLENYQLGIALGGLESDLLTLSHYFTLFPQQGVLKPLKLYNSGFSQMPYYQTPMEQISTSPKVVGSEADVQLINKILNDRDTGVDQFGIISNLNLPYKNYALKTGTSRDYHDSWTIGYTPDFLVGVWVGNSNNTAMKQITGLSGAAKIWREVMLKMYNSSYNQNMPFKFNLVQDIQSGNTLDFGLKGDDYEKVRTIMLNNNLVLSPHQDDKFLLQDGASVPFSANTEVTWSVNGKFLAKSQKIFWPIKEAGTYTIEAEDADGKKEQVTIYINKP